MAWTPEVTSVNQRTLIGAESNSALGTAVTPTKQLGCFDWQDGIETDVTFYTASGDKYVGEQEENMEWVSSTMGGEMDYNGLIYPLASACGAITPVANGASSSAKDWIFTPPITGSIVPQTYTFQNGDTVRARSFTYGLFTQFGYKFDRKTTTASGTLIGQPINEGITMATNPTVVSLAPIVGKQFNVYVDSTSAGIGTTLLTRVMSVDYNFSNIYGASWFVQRGALGYTAHVDLKPATTLKLMLEADANGMTFLSYLQSGTTYYMRVDAQGATIDAPNSIKNEFKHDIAFKAGKPSKYQDKDGITAIEWELTIVKDPSWNNGQAQQFTLTNLLTSL